MQEFGRAIAVLDVGRMDRDRAHRARRADKDVPLAPGNFLARVAALRVDRRRVTPELIERLAGMDNP